MGCWLVLLVGGATALGAQVHYGFDTTIRSRYEWRGLTRGSETVVQPDVFVAAGSGITWTAGLWTHVQAVGLDDDADDDADEVGYGRSWFGETNVWSEVASVLGPVDWALGWNWYLFDVGADAPAPPDVADTHEVYASAALLSLPWVVPRLTYFHDVDRVDGGFLEGALSLRVPLWTQVGIPAGSIVVTWEAGYNLGQQLDPQGVGFGYFASTGFTHADLSASTVVGYVPVSLFSSVHFDLALGGEFRVQRNLDDSTKRVGSEQHDWDTSWAFTFSVLGPRCEPTRRICGR